MAVPAANSRVRCTLGVNVLVGEVWGSATSAGFNLKIDGEAAGAPAIWINSSVWTVTAAA